LFGVSWWRTALERRKAWIVAFYWVEGPDAALSPRPALSIPQAGSGCPDWLGGARPSRLRVLEEFPHRAPQESELAVALADTAKPIGTLIRCDYNGCMELEIVAVLLAAPFVGSFLGVVIERLPAGRPVLLSRSSCDACARTLRPRDLLPIVSWIAQRGRCPYCRAELGAFYPAIELAALAVALSTAWLLPGWLLLTSCALGWTLLCLAVIDHRHFLLPDELTLPLIPAGLVVAWLIVPARLPDHMMGALAGFVAFALISFAYRHLRGREALPGVVLIGALSALTLALARSVAGGTLSATMRIAFGSHLALAIWLVWLFGPVLVA
jgi:leader peptidase (prepilin peptidase)/N-methyltransferase